MAVVLGEFDVVELPADSRQATAAPPPQAAPPDAASLERIAQQLLQRELRCFVD